MTTCRNDSSEYMWHKREDAEKESLLLCVLCVSVVNRAYSAHLRISVRGGNEIFLGSWPIAWLTAFR